MEDTEDTEENSKTAEDAEDAEESQPCRPGLLRRPAASNLPLSPPFLRGGEFLLSVLDA